MKQFRYFPFLFLLLLATGCTTLADSVADRGNGVKRIYDKPFEQVWDMSFDPTTSVVETHISRLRTKIDKPFDRELLHTRRGEGYVFGK